VHLLAAFRITKAKDEAGKEIEVKEEFTSGVVWCVPVCLKDEGSTSSLLLILQPTRALSVFFCPPINEQGEVNSLGRLILYGGSDVM
jgi:hypothetical protein